jgi:hypothetical protein
MKSNTKTKSNRKLLVAIFITSIFIFNNCQKVINVNLVDATPQMVIEGLITDSIGPYMVKLSKSGSYFDQPVLPPISNAIVVISDNAGTTDTLKEKLSGIYLTSKLMGKSGRTYTLMVLSENKIYSGSTTMLSHIGIDSLILKKGQSFGFRSGGNGQNDVRIDIHCIFKDPTEKNFYRIKVYTNDSTNVESYRLYDDQYTSGEETDLQVRRANVGDVSLVELISLDKFTYEYYRTLSDLLHSNPIFGSTPANPNSNLTNGALGYFGACSISSKTIVITDSLYNSIK